MARSNDTDTRGILTWAVLFEGVGAAVLVVGLVLTFGLAGI